MEQTPGRRFKEELLRVDQSVKSEKRLPGSCFSLYFSSLLTDKIASLQATLSRAPRLRYMPGRSLYEQSKHPKAARSAPLAMKAPISLRLSYHFP